MGLLNYLEIQLTDHGLCHMSKDIHKLIVGLGKLTE